MLQPILCVVLDLFSSPTSNKSRLIGGAWVETNSPAHLSQWSWELHLPAATNQLAKGTHAMAGAGSNCPDGVVVKENSWWTCWFCVIQERHGDAAECTQATPPTKMGPVPNSHHSKSPTALRTQEDLRRPETLSVDVQFFKSPTPWWLSPHSRVIVRGRHPMCIVYVYVRVYKYIPVHMSVYMDK